VGWAECQKGLSYTCVGNAKILQLVTIAQAQDIAGWQPDSQTVRQSGSQDVW